MEPRIHHRIVNVYTILPVSQHARLLQEINVDLYAIVQCGVVSIAEAYALAAS